MTRYRPAEAVVRGVRRCGIYVDVKAEGEAHEIMETYLEDSEAARIMSDTGEGIYIVDGRTTASFAITGIAAKLGCDQCGKCPVQDYSVQMEAPARVDEANIPELKQTYAQTVVDLSNARLKVARCILTQP